MTEKDKNTLTKMAEAFYHLPEAKKEHFLGYAEGVLDMTKLSAIQTVNTVISSIEECSA